jgi:hypothetical protein
MVAAPTRMLCHRPAGSGRAERTSADALASADVRSPAPPPSAPRLRARLDEAPPAPWHPVPLVELSVLAGIVLIVIGFATSGDDRPVYIFGGLALVSVAALELAVREHFAGYRSHTSLLSAVAAVLAAAALWLTPLPQEALLAAAVIVGALAFRTLRSAFAKRARGLTFRA